MARVNIVKQIKVGGKWVLRSIPKKTSGHYDWSVLAEGTYFIEWRESGQRKREPAGITAAQALEAQRKRRHELEGRRWNPLPSTPEARAEAGANLPLQALIDRYLGHIETLKKPNTYRKYDCVLQRFGEHFPGRKLKEISVEELNDFVVKLKKGGMSANTVLHNMIIIAQFSKRNGRPGLTKQLQLPEQVLPLPKVYTEQELERFLGACDEWERTLFSTFLLTGFREQEVMYLFWSDVSFQLRTIRVTAKKDLGFSPKRCEEREIPLHAELAKLIERHPRHEDCRFVFPSPTRNREQNMLLKCKAIAERCGLDPAKFDLKTFRSTYGTRMLRFGFDVRTVQYWMGHKSLETTMRYLAPAVNVQDQVDTVALPGVTRPKPQKKRPARETASTNSGTRTPASPSGFVSEAQDGNPSDNRQKF
jgi:integrase